VVFGLVGRSLPPNTPWTFTATFTDSACRAFLDGIVDNYCIFLSISDVHIALSTGMSHKLLKPAYAVHIEITLANNASLYGIQGFWMVAIYGLIVRLVGRQYMIYCCICQIRDILCNYPMAAL